VGYDYERGRAIADLHSAAASSRHPHWTWEGGGTWQYASPGGGWRAVVTCGEAGFSWEFRSAPDGGPVPGGGESGDIAAMWRAVKAGPEPAVSRA